MDPKSSPGAIALLQYLASSLVSLQLSAVWARHLNRKPASTVTVWTRARTQQRQARLCSSSQSQPRGRDS